MMDSCVYFILRKKTGLIKIGFSTSLHNRMKSLMQEYGELTILGFMEAKIETEKELHDMFVSNRVEGEWFLPSQSLLDFISANTTTSIEDIPTNGMVTTSIYIRKDILERLKAASGRHGVSVVLDKLGEMWLNKEVEIMITLQEAQELDVKNDTS